MNKNKSIWQVDAFTAQPFKGNPAGVCFLENDMPEEWMQNVAAEMNLSETAFISGRGNMFDIRFFTPEAEVPLCGHASLSAVHILFETGIVDRSEKIELTAKAGKLKAWSSGDWITLDFPAYKLDPAAVPDSFEQIIGIRPAAFHISENGWSFAVLNNEKEVKNISPDFGSMRRSEFGDLIVTAPSSDEKFDFCVRCFAPALGINEDPVTGSAHCVLVPYWAEKTGRTKLISHQVSAREGILRVELKGNRVEISGQAKTIIRGELLV